MTSTVTTYTVIKRKTLMDIIRNILDTPVTLELLILLVGISWGLHILKVLPIAYALIWGLYFVFYLSPQIIAILLG